MTDGGNSSQLWPEDVIEQAREIMMNRFDLDAAQALEVLRRMSRNSKTPIRAVAQQEIDHEVPVVPEAKCILFKATHEHD